MVLARTDALKTDGFEAAIERCLAFREAGCDMTFLEAPETIEQMEEYCRIVDGPKLANMLEQGSTPILPPQQLKSLGYTMAAYPLTLLSASIQAMNLSLERIKKGEPTDDLICKCKWILFVSGLCKVRSLTFLSDNTQSSRPRIMLVFRSMPRRKSATRVPAKNKWRYLISAPWQRLNSDHRPPAIMIPAMFSLV